MTILSKTSKKVIVAALTVATACVMLFAAGNTIIGHAATTAKVTASSVNIRQSASSSATQVSSASNGASITITGQTSGSDGYTWYQVYVDENTTGYVRSDLVKITDGSTPPTIGSSSTSSSSSSSSSSSAAPVDVNSDGVTPVNAVSGKVTGGQSVRVRADAGTSAGIVCTAQNGLSVEVTGTKNDSDGKEWYFVNFTDGGKNKTGYIRSDFLNLSGEITPVTAEEPVDAEVGPADAETGAATEPETVVTVNKKWDTQLQGEDWYLLNYDEGQQYKIQALFDNIETNHTYYLAEQKKAKTYLILMIVFLLLAVAGIVAASIFFLKWKDETDAVAFQDAERNNRNRQQSRPARPAQRGQASAGRPARPEGRPARPDGARPEGRPARPDGARPEGRPARPDGARPEGRPARPQGEGQPQRDAAREQAQRQQAQAEARNAAREQAQHQRKPVDDEDDDFEFGFLNWDEDKK